MKEQGDSFSRRLSRIPSDMKRLMEKRLELFILQIGDLIIGFVTRMIFKITGLVLLFVGFLFLLHALSMYTGFLLDNPILGYLIVSGVLLLIGILLYFLNPPFIVRNIREKLMRQLEKSVAEKLSADGHYSGDGAGSRDNVGEAERKTPGDGVSPESEKKP